MASVTVDGVAARVHRQGPEHGVPLLYLHSAFGEAGALPLFERLAGAGFRVSAPELPGFGHSAPVPGLRSIEDAVFHLRGTLDALDLDRPVVVGSCLGGWLAAELAVWFPERVDRLVLVGAAGLRVDGAPVFDYFAARQAETLARLGSAGRDLLGLLAPALDGDDDPNAPLLHLFHAAEATARLGWNPFLHDPKLRSRLGQIAVPTLVVWGDDDGIIPLAHGEAYAAAIPHARLELVDGGGHLPGLVAPDAVASLVAAFASAGAEV